MSVPRRYGVTVPFGGLPLHEHKPWYEELVALGYTDLWSAEAGGHEGLVPLTLAAAWTPTLRLGTAILPVYTRGAATLAEATASMCQAAPGRFALGIGCSSPDHRRELERGARSRSRTSASATRSGSSAPRSSGEKVTADYETFSVKGFRLDVPIPEMPPILVGALRGGMLRLAGREGDGAITNWLSPDDVPKIVEQVGPDKEIVARDHRAPDHRLRHRARDRTAHRSPPTSPSPRTRRSRSGSAAATRCAR